MGMVKINMVIRFLKEMQIDKICSLGEDEARDDNEQIQKVIEDEDIEMFYEMEME